MHPDFDTSGNYVFRLITSLPEDYRGMILRGADVITASSQEGLLIWQQLEQPKYSLIYSVLNCFRTIEINARQNKSVLVAFLALKNNIRYSIKGFGILQLYQGQFALLHTREHEVSSYFEKGKEYQSIEVSWSEEMVRQALPYFPFLQKLFSPEATKKSFYLQSPGRHAGAKALNLVNELLKTPYSDPLNQLYFEHKVREYLLLLLVEAGNKPSLKVKLTQDELDKIIALGERLSSEKDKKFPIAELAKELGMNEMKLKIAFKENFGKGIFEYHLDARMQEAQRLLHETDLTAKAIADMLGYNSTTSFITKFREYFGYPPGNITRNKRSR